MSSDRKDMDMDMGITVTARDNETGETMERTIYDDYVIVVAGSCHVASVQDHPGAGTQVLTIKGRKG